MAVRTSRGKGIKRKRVLELGFKLLTDCDAIEYVEHHEFHLEVNFYDSSGELHRHFRLDPSDFGGIDPVGRFADVAKEALGVEVARDNITEFKEKSWKKLFKGTVFEGKKF